VLLLFFARKVSKSVVNPQVKSKLLTIGVYCENKERFEKEKIAIAVTERVKINLYLIMDKLI